MSTSIHEGFIEVILTAQGAFCAVGFCGQTCHQCPKGRSGAAHGERTHGNVWIFALTCIFKSN